MDTKRTNQLKEATQLLNELATDFHEGVSALPCERSVETSTRFETVELNKLDNFLKEAVVEAHDESDRYAYEAIAEARIRSIARLADYVVSLVESIRKPAQEQPDESKQEDVSTDSQSEETPPESTETVVEDRPNETTELTSSDQESAAPDGGTTTEEQEALATDETPDVPADAPDEDVTPE